VALTRAAALAAVALATLLAGCGIGQTGPASRVTDVGATLGGKARNTEAGATRWRFEYGPSPTYGNATPWRESGTVEETIGGLAHGTTHHFRLCAADEHGRGVCGADAEFTTSTGDDSVVGHGLLVKGDPPATGDFSATVDAHSGASGAAPRGTAVRSPGQLSPHIPDRGTVTCLRVDGNRATIGFATDPSDADPEPDGGGLIYIKDNGTTGDYLNHGWEPVPPTTCPAATDDKFIAAPPGFDPPFAALIAGDFQVHDHPSGTFSRR
jgi:hypothetical protein